MMFVCGKPKVCVTKRSQGQHFCNSQYIMEAETTTRPREAVECYKRALIPADPHEITINLKLAKIHRTLDEHAEAVAYHRRVIEVCQADCECI
jgi:hypothetical protein